MFADYRVPQALVYLGLLEYSLELTARLTSPFPLYCLDHDDPLEIEIRANSIISIELVKNEIIKIIENDATCLVKKENVNSVLIDFLVWDLAKEAQDEMKMIPIHKTRCVYY